MAKSSGHPHLLPNTATHELESAMAAGLIAPGVDLQRLALSPSQRQAVPGRCGFKTVHASEDESGVVAQIFQNCRLRLQPITRLPGRKRREAATLARVREVSACREARLIPSCRET